MNRRERRSLLHELRRHGCACSPSVVGLPPTLVPDRALSGWVVDHERGCPLGEAVTPWNRLGMVPALTDTVGECQR